jgi:hypothetical protein
MNETTMTRGEFLRKGSCLATALGVGGILHEPQTAGADAQVSSSSAPARPLPVRPYKLLCLLCALGEDEAGPKDNELRNLLTLFRNCPDAPITLSCNAGVGFSFQEPAAVKDAGYSGEFSQKRDLTILQRLDVPPGETLPARMVLKKLINSIPLVAGICGFGEVTAEAWRGCPKADRDFYEKGCKKAVEALLVRRPPEEMARDKKASLQSMREADAVRVRPHIVVCSVCQYGRGIRPPYAEDNLPELLELMLTEKPDLRITLVPGADWAICAPCPYRNSQLGWCVTGKISAGGLYCELKDLNVLQRLGLTYGTTLKARDLYKLIFNRMPTVVGVCALDPNNKSPYSVWRDACGGAPDAERNYLKGRAELMAKLK